MLQSEYFTFGRHLATKNVGETSLLKRQLGDMEGEVKEIQMELEAIRKDNHMDVTVPVQDVQRYGSLSKYESTRLCTQENSSEISRLREELLRSKIIAEQEHMERQKYEDKVKELQKKLDVCTGESETQIKGAFKAEEEVLSLRSMLRDVKDEVEELKMSMSEKDEQLQEYRLKYLQAQQQVEEHKRQLDVVEYDNKQVSDQVHIEIQRMKMQFQEQLQELAFLPDMLKTTQLRLEEAKKLQQLAEHSCQEKSNELNLTKEQLVVAVNNWNQSTKDLHKFKDENDFYKITLGEREKELEKLTAKIENLKTSLLRQDEKLVQQEKLYKDKCAELTKLAEEFEDFKSNSNRSLNRCKERTESLRRHLQTQISELERQLVQSRAMYKTSQKERDEIRQKMMLQLNNLQENFKLVEIRLRSIQSEVVTLKNNYALILEDDEVTSD